MTWVNVNLSSSPTQSRSIALALLVAVFLLIAYLVSVFLLASLAAKYEQLSVMQERALRIQAVLADADSVRDQLSEVRRVVSNHSGFFTQPSESIAMSALQDRMQQLVSRHGGTVNSLSSGQSREAKGDLVELNLRLSFAISHAGLIDLLGEMQAERHDVFASSISVQSQGRNQDISGRLTVRMVAVALYLPSSGVVHAS